MSDVETGKKAQTHERIVRAAARALRRDGYDGTSVGKVMGEAGLTHGGFYAHFASREAMLAEGLDCAAGEALEALLGAAAVLEAGEDLAPLPAFVAAYLSDRHAAATETGCTIAALGTETRRQPAEIRRVATRRITELARMLERRRTERDPEPLAILASLVGALVIARAVDDPQLSRAVRDATAKLVAKPRRPR